MGLKPSPLDLADLPGAPDTIADLPQPGADGWSSVIVRDGEREAALLLIRHGDQTLCYLNKCPHAGHRLEGFAGETVWSPGGRYLQCASHGARFRPQNGKCVRGPCKGAYLRRVLDC